ncbi:MAG: RluA family pseudouridine synthase [Sandaracinaceae bacterium]
MSGAAAGAAPYLEIEATREDAGSRLDVVLSRRVPGLSRRRAQEMLEEGSIRLDGRRARKGDRVGEGDRIALAHAPVPSDFPAKPDASVPIPILFEDAHLAVLDKPGGVPSHPLRPEEVGTAASFVVARWPETCVVGYRAREPGIVHRLDTGTSGLLLVAKDTATFEALRAQLEAEGIDKRYRAFVAAGARIDPHVIDAPIANDPRDPRKVAVGAHVVDGRPARTQVLSVRGRARAVELELRAPHAFRHQVRAHLASEGHPLLGDLLYGGEAVAGLSRHALHACALRLVHPVTGRPLRVDSPLPPDLAALG